MANASRAPILRRLLICWAVVFACGMNLGCDGRVAPPDPDVKVELTKLLRLYQLYVERNQKGPPNEQALRQFAEQLSAEDREAYLLGDDLEGIFTSPRDNQPYAIQYNLKLNAAETRAVAWEANGKDGKRFVALSIGYVEEYDEGTFKEYTK